MCIISDKVNNISSTKIFTIPSKNGKRQLTIYSNTVSTPESNVMCLPVPNPSSIRFENVPSTIFNQCHKSFNINKSICNDLFSTFYNSSYNAIIVRSINDINNQNGFILTDKVVDFLKKNYSNFGFILCKLKKGNATYKPLAYSHDIQNSIFCPTKHYYTSIREEMSFDYISIQEKKATRAIDDWDHEIYSVATPLWAHESNKLQLYHNKIKWYDMPTDFYLDPLVIIRCYEKYGYHPNIDIEMPYILSLIY